MCLTASSRDHRQVMSSGNPTTVPSSTPIIITKQAPSNNQTEVDEKDNSSSSQYLDATGKNNLASSISDPDLQATSMGPSVGSAPDSLEAGPREVASLDEDVMDQLLKRDARSAFEITSIRPANTDDLDKSGIRHPTSTDSLQVLQEKGESGGSEESIITPSDTHQLVDSQEESSQVAHTETKFTCGESSPAEQMDSASEAGGITSSPKTLLIGDEVSSKASNQSGLAAPPGNGASVQPNRFRRVNQYERGRWTVRDSLVTEEQSETLHPQQQQQQPLPSAKHPESSEVADDTHPKTTQQQRSDLGPTPVELTELGGFPGGILGGGLAPTDSTSDKDSSSIHMDRSSTAAETLSRNTSMSSIVAPEKSVDGDEILRDLDMESISGGTGNQNSSGQEQEVSDAPPAQASPHPPVVPTSSAGAVPPPSSTAASREEQATPGSSAPVTGNVDLKRVEHAMSFLQNELKQVLTSSSYPQLIHENKVLKDQRTDMANENTKLKAELRVTREENERLRKELKELRVSLTRLAQPIETSAGSSGSGSTVEQGSAEEQVATTPSSSVDTSNSSQKSIT